MESTDSVLSMEEVLKKFAGNYVAMQVTSRDSNGQPTSGRVLHVHFNKYRLRDEMADRGEICIFYAGPAPKPGYVGEF